jgi:hypothetical protein
VAAVPSKQTMYSCTCNNSCNGHTRKDLFDSQSGTCPKLMHNAPGAAVPRLELSVYIWGGWLQQQYSCGTSASLAAWYNLSDSTCCVAMRTYSQTMHVKLATCEAGRIDTGVGSTVHSAAAPIAGLGVPISRGPMRCTTIRQPFPPGATPLE